MRLLPGHASRAPAGAERLLRHGPDQDQRDRILRATAELVAKHGYHGTTVEHIIKKAHVAYPTFYKHFEAKEDAFLTLLHSSGEEAMQRIAEAFDGAGDDWPKQLAAALRTLFAMIVEEPLVARACVVESLTAGPKAVAAYERGLVEAVPLLTPGRDLVPDGVELPERLESTLVHAIVWMVYQRLIVGALDQIDDLLPEALELVLRPYLGDEAAREELPAPPPRVAS